MSKQKINVDFDSLRYYTQCYVGKHRLYLHLSRLIIEPEVTRSPTVKAAGKSSRCLRRLISHQSTRNRDSASILIPQHSPTYLETATSQVTNNMILTKSLGYYEHSCMNNSQFDSQWIFTRNYQI